MNISIEFPDVAGYELAEGKQPRDPIKGEVYTTFIGDCVEASYNYHANPRVILKKKAPVYKEVGKSSSFFDGEYVEIKALEDAMRIIKSMNEDPDLKAEAFDYYAPLRELIK